MASIKPQDLPSNLPEKVTKSYDKANKAAGSSLLEKGKEILDKGKEKVKEIISDAKEGDLPPNLPEKVKESYRKANLDVSHSSLLDKGKETIEKGKEALEKGKEKVKDMFRPEIDLPRNVPDKVLKSHLEYSARLYDEQPTIIEKGKEVLEKGKEQIKEFFQKGEDEDENDIPSDVPEVVKESHLQYDETNQDSETLFQKIEGTLESTFEKGKEKIISLFSGNSDHPDWDSTTPDIVKESYENYEERLKEEQPSLLDKVKGLFSSSTEPEVAQEDQEDQLDVPSYVPERVKQSHLEYEENLTSTANDSPSLIMRGKDMVKDMLGI